MLNSLQWKSIELQNKELRLLMFYKITHNCVSLPIDMKTSLRATRGNQLTTTAKN